MLACLLLPLLSLRQRPLTGRPSNSPVGLSKAALLTASRLRLSAINSSWPLATCLPLASGPIVVLVVVVVVTVVALLQIAGRLCKSTHKRRSMAASTGVQVDWPANYWQVAGQTTLALCWSLRSSVLLVCRPLFGSLGLSVAPLRSVLLILLFDSLLG